MKTLIGDKAYLSEIKIIEREFLILILAKIIKEKHHLTSKVQLQIKYIIKEVHKIVKIKE